MAPGKKDHTYKGRAQGRSLFEQKRYLLWPLKDLHETLNGRYEPDDENSYLAKFGKELPFRLFYQFIRENKEYVYNEEMPHFSCLCEVCENGALLAKGLERECQAQKIPTNPHSIVEQYSCNSSSEDCMIGDCEDCPSHGLSLEDFKKGEQEEINE